MSENESTVTTSAPSSKCLLNVVIIRDACDNGVIIPVRFLFLLFFVIVTNQHVFQSLLYVISGCYWCLVGSLLAAKTSVSTPKVNSAETSDKEVEKATPKPSEWPRCVNIQCDYFNNNGVCRLIL